MATRRSKPSDHFTRFTSATPHATSFQTARPSQPLSASASGSSSHPGRRLPPSNGPPGETPAQKVARLRAAHRAAQEAAEYSLADKIIANGRIVADKLHRGTAYTLMGLTVVSVVLATYSFVGLITHNRRQKRAWIERELQKLQDAQLAFLRGEATAEQLHILEQERAGEAMNLQDEQERRVKKANSLWGKTKRSLYGMAGIEEQESMGDLARKGEFSGILDMVKEKRLQDQQLQQQQEQSQHGLLTDPPSAAQSSFSSPSSPSSISSSSSSSTLQPHLKPNENQNQTSTPRFPLSDGMLDQMAANAAAALTSTSSHSSSSSSPSSKSWFSWGRGDGETKT